LKLGSKIIIDRFIGLPIVYTLNALARALGILLRLDHTLDRPFKTIAVSKFVGLGSIIQSQPLLAALRKQYPDARIIFITSKGNQGLFEFIPIVDDVFIIEDSSFLALIRSSISLLFRIWRNRPDVLIDLEIYSNYSSILGTMSLAKNRMGFYKNDKYYRKGLYTHMMFFNMKSPISQSYLQFARLLNCGIIDGHLSLTIPEDNKITLSEIGHRLNLALDQNYIIINPNASDLRIERRWRADNFVLLLDRLVQQLPDYKFILIGSVSEQVYVNNIYERVKNRTQLINSAGQLSLKELVVLIAHAQQMVTNDTGPMHIAFALKVKTVALFGPCSPEQYGGSELARIIYKNVYCSPCVHEFITPPCRGDNQCMIKILVHEVLEATMANCRDEQLPITKFSIDYTSDSNLPLGRLDRRH
jgi:ADP-heptose:LPS heptosyltransferase